VTPSESDAVLVEHVLAGDSAPFDELASRHRADLLRFLKAAIGDGDEAESLAQETLVRALAGLHRYQPEAPFRGYLFGIARNLIRNHFRSLRRHAHFVAPDELARVAASPEGPRSPLSELVRGETRRHLKAAVESLPEPFRRPFILHFVEGLDYAEISRRTGVAEGTLRVRTHRACTLLRAKLGAVVDTWLAAGHRPSQSH
jgi:RNA polymerase sigma-70 factor (ECF subfamily)